MFEWSLLPAAFISLGYTISAVLSVPFVLLWQSSIVGRARRAAGVKYPQGMYVIIS